MACETYCAGQLRHIVTIRNLTRTDDGRGSWTDAVTDITGVRVSLWPVSSRDALLNLTDVAQSTHHMRLRYRPDIKPTSVILYGTRVFVVVGTPRNIEERGRWLEVDLREDVKQ